MECDKLIGGVVVSFACKRVRVSYNNSVDFMSMDKDGSPDNVDYKHCQNKNRR